MFQFSLQVIFILISTFAYSSDGCGEAVIAEEGVHSCDFIYKRKPSDFAFSEIQSLIVGSFDEYLAFKVEQKNLQDLALESFRLDPPKKPIRLLNLGQSHPIECLHGVSRELSRGMLLKIARSQLQVYERLLELQVSHPGFLFFHEQFFHFDSGEASFHYALEDVSRANNFLDQYKIIRDSGGFTDSSPKDFPGWFEKLSFVSHSKHLYGPFHFFQASASSTLRERLRRGESYSQTFRLSALVHLGFLKEYFSKLSEEVDVVFLRRELFFQIELLKKTFSHPPLHSFLDAYKDLLLDESEVDCVYRTRVKKLGYCATEILMPFLRYHERESDMLTQILWHSARERPEVVALVYGSWHDFQTHPLLDSFPVLFGFQDMSALDPLDLERSFIESSLQVEKLKGILKSVERNPLGKASVVLKEQ